MTFSNLAVIVGISMKTADLVQRLVELEDAALRSDYATTYALVLTVEQDVLDLQKMTVRLLQENATLRQRLEKYESTRDSPKASNAE